MKKIKLENVKEKRIFWLRAVVSLILITFFIFLAVKVIKKQDRFYYATRSFGIENQSIVGEILRGMEIRQEITAGKDFQGVQILFANYANHNINSDYTISILDENKKVLVEKKVNAGEIGDNTFYSVAAQDIEYSEGDKLSIVIRGENSEHGNALTIWKSNGDRYPEGDLYIDGNLTEGDLVIKEITEIGSESNAVEYKRFFLFLGLCFILLHVWLPIPSLYLFVFKHRAYIALAVFIFMVSNSFHFSSIGMFDSYIQTGQGSKYSVPVWGSPLSIRSDEWLVFTPRKLTLDTTGLTGTNNIPMALEQDAVMANGIKFSWSVFTRPLSWGYLTGNATFGTSFYWNSMWILMFLSSFELCLILSKEKKLLSLAGACLLSFSSFFMWWSGSSAVLLLYAQAAIVCLYYALRVKNKYKRLFWGTGAAIFGASFAAANYPAWQVPIGYVFLAILIWMIYQAKEQMRKFDFKDWTIVSVCIVLLGSFVVTYIIDNMDYSKAVLNTVYPGRRVSSGGFYLQKLTNYIGSWAFKAKWEANPSEAGTFFNLFPIPMILGIVYMIKGKKWNGLLGGLTIASAFLTLFCGTGIPLWLSKITLMSYSTHFRAVDILAVSQLYLFIAIAGRIENKVKFSWPVAGSFVFAVILITAYFFEKARPAYFNKFQLLAIVIVITFCVTPWISRARAIKPARIISCFILCFVSMSTALSIHPLMKGLDAIYAKPAAKEIKRIVNDDRDATWITLDSIVSSGFTIACGARTINSTNYVPNVELWKILDPEEKWSDIYNRYAHMSVHLTDEDTYVKLLAPDYFMLYLSYDDLQDIGVKYIYADHDMENGENVMFELIYKENGSYIYKVAYNQS